MSSMQIMQLMWCEHCCIKQEASYKQNYVEIIYRLKT